MPCHVEFSNDVTITVAISADELQDMWRSSRGTPFYAPRASGDGGEWLNPAHIVRFYDVAASGAGADA